MRKWACLAFVVWVLGAASPAWAKVTAADIFGSGMVLQREMKVPVWGKAEAGEEVVVSFGVQKVMAQTGKDGKWKAVLEPMKANEVGQEMSIAGRENTLVFKDVLVGEVWLGSGQSNMVWELRQCLNGKEEIAAANHPNIRFFTAGYAAGEDQGYKIVPTIQAQRYALKPREKVLGEWKACTPANAANFSGVSYFFARRLHQELGVPVGMVVSAVGATSIEAWMSLDSLKEVPAYRERAEAFELLAKDYLVAPQDAENLAKALEAEKMRLAARQAKWFEELDAQDVGILGRWMAPEMATKDWGKIMLPVSMADNPIGSPVASIWFRKEVAVPEGWAGKELVIRLGVIDAVDETYVNGRKVGRTWFDAKEYWSASRVYTVPADVVTGNRVVVAMRLLKMNYHMAPLGPAGDMRLELATGGPESVSLAGEWVMKKAQDLDAGRQPKPAPTVGKQPGGHYCQPGVMHNGMIHPIKPYAIRGVFWYQGGANGPYYVDYRSLQPAIVRAWRREWGQGDFPFLAVQQQEFWEQQTTAVERGGYTNLREAQAKVLTVPGGMLITVLGVGESTNPHNKNKQEVGRRAALSVLGQVYKKPILHSGPMYKAMKVEGEKVRLIFDHAQGGLHALGDPPVGFAIAGEDRAFYFAKAKIEGEEVVVWSERVPKPVAVRYAWATNPVCNLYNAQELPMFPFATDSWDLAQLVIPKDAITIPTGWKPK
jgi:sialate O-acetylesterase